jgi:hypothetical protein
MKTRAAISFAIAAAAALLALNSNVAAQAAAPAEPGLDSALEQWRASHGPSWDVFRDAGTGYAEFLYGGSARFGFAPRSDAQWFAAARESLALASDLHGIEGATLVEHFTQFLPLGMVGTSDKMTVRFRQAVGGVPVDGGYVNVLFDARGTLLSIQTRALPGLAGFDTHSALTAELAGDYALTAFATENRIEGALVHAPELVIAQIEDAETRFGVLCWRAEVLWESGGGEVEGGVYFIDARSGRVARRDELIHHFDISGNVKSFATPGTSPDTGSNPEVQQNLKYTRVTSGAVTTTTDANGNFTLVGVNAPANATFGFNGTYNSISNQAGAPYSLVANLAAPSGNNVVLNSPANDLATAQANINIAVNADRDWVRATNPTDSKADFVHTANANIASTCNAYFNGSSINFYTAGGGCVNTAFSTVASHEDGHWLNVIYGTGNGNDGMGEGNADMWAMYVWDTPVVGQGFSGTGTMIRTGLNTRQFCGDSNPGCYSGVHANGEVWMGAGWKVRRNLKNTLGSTQGILTSNALLLGWMNSYNQTQIRSVIETQWLTLDDNDGNINNGTPRFTAIDSAFREQGFPGVTLIPFTFAGVTSLPSTANEAGPYVVNAQISSNFGGTISAANLLYRVGTSGGFTTVPMTSGGGNSYSAAIPGQPAPAVVQYYLEATDSFANSAAFPTGAPAVNVRVFGVGALTTVLSDDFNSDLGWSVTNTSVSAGAWTRGVPVGTTNAGDQAQPGSGFPGGVGSNCYFTGQGAAGGAAGTADLDGGPTQLVSPLFDATLGAAALVRYAAWLYNDDGDDSLSVAVSANNGSSWVTVRTYTGLRGGWIEDSFEVSSFVTPSANMRLRFSAADSPNNSITEAAVDLVSVVTVDGSPCSQIANYCTSKINSQLCEPTITATGSPSVGSGAPFYVSADNVINQKSAILFYGYAAAALPFKGGTLCVQPPVRRTPPVNTGGSVGPDNCSGAPVYNLNQVIQGGGDPNLGAGATIYMQWYYRDPLDAQGVGLTDGASAQICP